MMAKVINLNKYRYERELVIDEFIEEAEAQIRHLNYLIKLVCIKTDSHS